ncbi:MAG: HDOD domain-containing protein [Phycisphaerae bacterium]|nr:HDOD domain-containing protein [Gemmatimonadaceae bacterium]
MSSPSTLSIAEQLASALTRPGNLAPLPAVALQAMRLAESPNANSHDLVRVISSDPALCARIIRIVNSAFYGMRTPVTSLNTAVSVLGFGAIKNIALAASLTRTFRGTKDAAFDPRSLWVHSVAVGAAAQLIAARTRTVDASDAFLAGVMHDIGVIVELQLSRIQFLGVLKATERDPALRFRDVERNFFGATHEDYGEALAIAWQFPANIRQVCGLHHRPLESSEDARLVTSIVHLADIVAAQSGAGFTRTVETLEPDANIMRIVGVTDDILAEIRDSLPAQIAEVLPLLEGA